jgi:hypothetical protein
MIGKGQGHDNLTRICLDEIVMEPSVWRVPELINTALRSVL